MKYNSSQYLHRALVPTGRTQILRYLSKEVRGTKTKFDVIVCRGLSGTLIAPAIADRVKVPLIVLRKDEKSHGQGIEYPDVVKQAKRYIIIDDFIATGNTLNAIVDEMQAQWPKMKCAGVFFWRSSDVKEAAERTKKEVGIKVLNKTDKTYPSWD